MRWDLPAAAARPVDPGRVLVAPLLFGWTTSKRPYYKFPVGLCQRCSCCLGLSLAMMRNRNPFASAKKMNELKGTEKKRARREENWRNPMVSLLRWGFRTTSNFGCFVIDSDPLRRIYWRCRKFLGHAVTCTFGVVTTSVPAPNS